MFYERLSELCNRHGTNITTFAKANGISKGSPSNWKRGASPNSDVVIKVAQYFHVTTDYLLGQTDIPNAQSERIPEGIELDEWELLKEYRAADTQTKQLMLSTMHTISDTMSMQKRVGKSLYSSPENDEQEKGTA